MVSGNTITGVRCGLHTTTSPRNTEGIKMGQERTGNSYINNKIGDFQTLAACNAAIPSPPGNTSYPGSALLRRGRQQWTDRGERDFRSYPAGQSGDTTFGGMFIESRCIDWTIRNNTVNVPLAILPSVSLPVLAPIMSITLHTTIPLWPRIKPSGFTGWWHRQRLKIILSKLLAQELLQSKLKLIR